MWGKHGFSMSAALGNSQSNSFLLRLTRTAEVATFEASEDGNKWFGTPTLGKHLTSNELTLTLFAQHASSKARTVTFSEFEIKPIEKKK